jgi:RND superfamily putative drug exporter
VDLALGSLRRHSHGGSKLSLLIRFKWLVLGAWLVIIGLSSLLPSLSSVARSSNSDFLPKGAPSVRAAEVASRGLTNSTDTSRLVVVASSTRSSLTPEQVALLGRLEKQTSRLKYVRQIIPVGVSRDNKAYQFIVLVSVTTAGPPSSAVPAILAELRKAYRPYQSHDLQIHVTGALAAIADADTQTGRSQRIAQSGSAIFILVLLFLVFRSPLAPLATFAPAVVALLVSQRLIAETSRIGLQVSPITQILLVVIVLGAGTDYGLFLVFRLREELRKGVPFTVALDTATRRVRATIFFSALTVISAFLTLALSDFGVYRWLGPALAIGVATVLLANLTLLPSLLAILRGAFFWPFPPKAGQRVAGLWGRIAAAVVRRPITTLALGGVAFVALASFVPFARLVGFGNQSNAPATSDSYAGQKVLAAHFSALDFNPTYVAVELEEPVAADPSVVASCYAFLEKDRDFKSVEGPLNPEGYTLSLEQLRSLASLKERQPSENAGRAVGSLENAVAQYLSPDGKVVRFVVSLAAGPPGSDQAVSAVPRIRQHLSQMSRIPGVAYVGLAGEDSFIYDVAHYSAADLKRIIPIVLACLFVILVLLIGSLVAPLYLVATVGLSYLAALGFVVLAFQVLGHQGGVNFVLPFLMFVFIMALGEDYNILVAARIKEESSLLPLRQAVTTAVAATGTTVTSAGLILAGTFGDLVLTGVPQIQQIGFGLAFGVLLDTFVVRTLLVPSCAVLFGKANWWPDLYRYRAKASSAHEDRAPRRPLEAKQRADAK